ncbi:soluble lytic murein transglycosylase [Rhodovulum iodosum]|uniref:Soluble lytic murein transglycosylase n=1 Tax=Rhodovulum iodosum TaxID=68291 RepID=A0ABV3XZ87_9RHOB|nr:lytic transglycosylase domain-containing protein [Rhodovulum robiginosum]RSK38095.1 lytic transglycosylase domain-containing protein [Rhodovulum robiginosum]
MRLLLALLPVLTLAVVSPAPAQTPLELAMREVRADNWVAARRLAGGQVARDIVEWRFLRAGEGSFADYSAFLSRNGDWPGLDRIRARAEAAIPADAAAEEVVAFFAGRRPITGNGALRLVQAHAALGQVGDAEALAVLTWRSMPLSSGAQVALLSRFPQLLAAHHTARIDAMLWQGEEASARRMLPLVPAGWQALAEARLALRARAPGVDARIAAVPGALADDAGLAYERFLWRTRKGLQDDAIALLVARSATAEGLGQPELWSNWRRIYARRAMRADDGALAYRLAARHHLSEGSAYADLEWLAGFVALRQLGDAETALGHFDRFAAAVETPISLGRAGYWQGRALEALGRGDEAQAAYARAGQHQTAFYGLLAAERAGLPLDPALTGQEVYPDWREASFADSSVLEAAVLFHRAGERNLAEWFLTHLAETARADGQRQLAGLALSLDDPHIAVRIAKVAAGQGNVMPRAYFPVTDLARARHPVDTELVLAIARRESEFDPVVTSGAGARGLMQLMPRTAEAMARKVGAPYSSAALLTDPEYNARLGGAYLAQLVEEFGPNPLLVAAAYNAGPSRARRWVEDRGDPRMAGTDVVDWIEMIPFRETRNYVMRVSESLPVYRARLSGETGPIRFTDELAAR